MGAPSLRHEQEQHGRGHAEPGGQRGARAASGLSLPVPKPAAKCGVCDQPPGSAQTASDPNSDRLHKRTDAVWHSHEPEMPAAERRSNSSGGSWPSSALAPLPAAATHKARIGRGSLGPIPHHWEALKAPICFGLLGHGRGRQQAATAGPEPPARWVPSVCPLGAGWALARCPPGAPRVPAGLSPGAGQR